MDESSTCSRPSVDCQQPDDDMKTYLSERLVQSGEKERLKELLRLQLVECGWHEDMKQFCKAVIRNRGIECVTVEDLIEEIVPRARAAVPEEVKSETLEKIKAFLAREVDDKGATSEKKNDQQLAHDVVGTTD